jgi:hypothetical protein
LGIVLSKLREIDYDDIENRTDIVMDFLLKG